MTIKRLFGGLALAATVAACGSSGTGTAARATQPAAAAPAKLPPCSQLKDGDVIADEQWEAGLCLDGSGAVPLTAYYQCRDGRKLRSSSTAWAYTPGPIHLGALPGDEVIRCKAG